LGYGARISIEVAGSAIELWLVDSGPTSSSSWQNLTIFIWSEPHFSGYLIAKGKNNFIVWFKVIDA